MGGGMGNLAGRGVSGGVGGDGALGIYGTSVKDRLVLIVAAEDECDEDEDS